MNNYLLFGFCIIALVFAPVYSLHTYLSDPNSKCYIQNEHRFEKCFRLFNYHSKNQNPSLHNCCHVFEYQRCIQIAAANCTSDGDKLVKEFVELIKKSWELTNCTSKTQIDLLGCTSWLTIGLFASTIYGCVILISCFALSLVNVVKVCIKKNVIAEYSECKQEKPLNPLLTEPAIRELAVNLAVSPESDEPVHLDHSPQSIPLKTISSQHHVNPTASVLPNTCSSSSDLPNSNDTKENISLDDFIGYHHSIDSCNAYSNNFGRTNTAPDNHIPPVLSSSTTSYQPTSDQGTLTSSDDSVCPSTSSAVPNNDKHIEPVLPGSTTGFCPTSISTSFFNFARPKTLSVLPKSDSPSEPVLSANSASSHQTTTPSDSVSMINSVNSNPSFSLIKPDGQTLPETSSAKSIYSSNYSDEINNILFY